MEDTRYPSLRGRVVAVTGGASGIGEAIVRAFVRNGARVACLDIQQDAGQRLTSELTGTGADVSFHHCDLTDVEAVRGAFDGVRSALGPVAALVNNAANDKRADFLDVTVDEFDWMMAVNLRHVFFAAQSVAPHMRDIGYGSIINMTSVGWLRGVQDLQAYSAAKAGIVGFTNSLARQLGPDRIRVNALAPGVVITERQKQLWFQDEGKLAASLALQCLPDPVEVDDIAKACLFLASDDSKMITKQMLLINAGSL